jgi:hypothetical protein
MIRIFTYIEELDAFVVSSEYKKIAEELGLKEWNEVVWIGRYFLLDNDYGEHWFDNWQLRDRLESRSSEVGIKADRLLIIDPDRFKNDKDGPCHSKEHRKKFWTDVLISLELSYETLINEAVLMNKARTTSDPDYVADLDEKIAKIRSLNPQ